MPWCLEEDHFFSGRSLFHEPRFSLVQIIHFFLSENKFFSTPSLFTVSITISPYLIDPSDWWKMGGSASSELVNGNDAEMTKQSMTNLRLRILADTGESNGLSFNLVEAATCGIALVIGLFLLRWCCIKKATQDDSNATGLTRGHN